MRQINYNDLLFLLLRFFFWLRYEPDRSFSVLDICTGLLLSEIRTQGFLKV